MAPFATYNIGDLDGYVGGATFSPDKHILATGARDDSIQLWDVASGNLLRTLSGHSDYVYAAAFSPDGQTLASGSKDLTIKLWNVTSGALLQTLSSTTGQINSLAFLDEHTLVSVSREGYVSLWKV